MHSFTFNFINFKIEKFSPFNGSFHVIKAIILYILVSQNVEGPKEMEREREREREREISVNKSMKLALVLGVYDLTTCGVFREGGGGGDKDRGSSF